MERLVFRRFSGAELSCRVHLAEAYRVLDGNFLGQKCLLDTSSSSVFCDRFEMILGVSLQ